MLQVTAPERTSTVGAIEERNSMAGFISDNPTGSAWISGERKFRRPLTHDNLESQFLAGNIRGAAKSRERRARRARQQDLAESSYTNHAHQEYMRRQHGGNAFHSAEGSAPSTNRINSAPAPTPQSSAPAGTARGQHSAPDHPWHNPANSIIQMTPSARNKLGSMTAELRRSLESFASDLSTAATNREPARRGRAEPTTPRSAPSQSTRSHQGPASSSAQPSQATESEDDESEGLNWVAIVIVAVVMLNFVLGGIFG